MIDAIDESKANCNIYNEKLTRGGSNAGSYRTSALINHLRLFHRAKYNEHIRYSESQKRLRNDVQDKKKDNRKHKQFTVDFFVEEMTPLTSNNRLIHAITKVIGEMIATDMQPFVLVTYYKNKNNSLHIKKWCSVRTQIRKIVHPNTHICYLVENVYPVRP